MHKRVSGFTIVELLVVILIIGILSAITILSFSKIQSDSRNAERSAKVTVVAEALEKYYDKNGEYPGCTAMTASVNTVTTNTLINMDGSNLATPSAAAGTNSYGCTALTSGAGSDTFAYVGDTSSSCSTGGACLQYTLQYREEGTGNIISRVSRHTVALSTSGAPVLSGTTTNTTLTATWTAISNVTNYVLYRSTDSGFSSGNTVTASTTGTSITQTGLITGTKFWLKVVPQNGSTNGAVSNVDTEIMQVYGPSAFNMSSSTSYSGSSKTLSASVPTNLCDPNTTPQYKWSKNGATGVVGTTPSASVSMSNGGSAISLASSIACKGAAATSNYVSAGNNSVSTTWPSPTAVISVSDHRTADYSATCPSGTTSKSYAWKVQSQNFTANGSDTSDGTYSNQGTAWGDGGAHMTISCAGPWSPAVTSTGYSGFGADCVPTITNASTCYYP